MASLEGAQDRLAVQLMELLLGDAERMRRAAEAIGVSVRWREAIAEAVRWKVVPQFFARAQGAAVPVAELAALRRELLLGRGHTVRRAVKASAGIACLEAAGIPVVAFKGLASMAELYSDAHERTIHDADLLVQPRDLERAVTCLERGGFARQGKGSLADYLRFVENAPGFAGNKAVTLYADGAEIDLHWELKGSGLNVTEILSRARRATLRGQSIPTPDAGDSLQLTIRHAIRENLAAGKICRDLHDVRRRCEREDPATLLDRAAAAQGEAPALAVLGVLHSYDAAPPVTRAFEYLTARANAASRRSAARLIELFKHQLRYGALGKDVFYLVHSRPWRQIMRGLGTGWSDYRRNLKEIEEQLDQERSWTSRAAALLRALPGPRTMYLARELARVKYGWE